MAGSEMTRSSTDGAPASKLQCEWTRSGMMDMR